MVAPGSLAALHSSPYQALSACLVRSVEQGSSDSLHCLPDQASLVCLAQSLAGPVDPAGCPDAWLDLLVDPAVMVGSAYCLDA